jgi:hypothetical protein
MCGIIQRTLKNKTRKDTQIHFVKMSAAVLIYGSENWALNRSEIRKIKTAEMRFIRYVSGFTLADHVCNTAICEAL